MTKVCNHPPCPCETAPDERYCSDSCHAADRSNPQGATCACGHEGCDAEAPSG